MFARLMVLAAALTLASGCIIVDTGPPQGGPVAPIAVGVGITGAPPNGYTITANTGSYRITWAGFQNFSGSVWVRSGTPQFAAGCSDGSCALGGGEDYVRLGAGGRIDFDSFPASGKRSGFDLFYTGDITLDLYVNDQRRPDLVVFVSGVTRQLASAPAMPFGLTM
jgi:hypothetical protein